MVVYAVNVYVKEEFIEDFISATEINHKSTRKETGNLRFDVIQMADDPGRFMLYEVYRDDEAVSAHKETEHYLEWRKTVEPYMARAREGVKYRPHFPAGESEW